MFDRYDRDHDGRIQIDEFRQMLNRGNDHLDEDIPSDVIDEILEISNWNRDKYLTFDEFLRMVNFIII